MILAFAGVAAFFCIFYSGGIFRLSYRGLGELIIGIMFGPLSMMGIFFVATGEFSIILTIISFAIGLLVSNIIYTHSILDVDADREVNKMTMAVLIGNKKTMLAVSFLMNFLPFIIIITGVVLNILAIYYLFVLLALPMAISLFYLLIQFHKNPQKEFSPRFWMGPFEK